MQGAAVRFLFISFFFLHSLLADSFPGSSSFPLEEKEPSLLIQNAILAKVHDTPITVMDVVKKLDVQFYRMYPDLKEKTMARYQFYKGSWKYILQDLIHTELILLDATKKEVKISEGEIREEFENRFGPNSLLTLEKLNLTFEQAWEMLRKELIVQKMLGFFVHYRAQQRVTPETIWSAYQAHLQKNPPTKEFSYRVISVKASSKEEAKELAEKAACSLVDYTSDLDSSKVYLDEIKRFYTKANIQISPLYSKTREDLSAPFLKALEPLQEKMFSSPIEFSQNDSSFYRIFYLQQIKEKQGAGYRELSAPLREEVFQKKAEEASSTYLEKLKRIYKHDIRSYPSKDFEPFVLQ